jgi:ADP-ribose pyrophosphatase YjhB (NUDIX family)
MRVKVRAVVVQDGRLLVARDRHRGVDRLMLPGGRVHERESITSALIRGVADTARLAIDPVKLLYVVEIPGLYAAYDLTLVWLAELIEPAISLPDASLIDLGTELPVPLDPPILGEIAADAEDGWPNNPRWLGGMEPRRGRPRIVTRARRLTAT